MLRHLNYSCSNKWISNIRVSQFGALVVAQVRNAQAHGAVGVVFFLPEADLRNFPFPEPVWIGDKVIQPGSLANTFGDPLTPGYQSDGEEAGPFCGELGVVKCETEAARSMRLSSGIFSLLPT